MPYPLDFPKKALEKDLDLNIDPVMSGSSLQVFAFESLTFALLELNKERQMKCSV